MSNSKYTSTMFVWTFGNKSRPAFGMKRLHNNSNNVDLTPTPQANTIGVQI